MPFASYFRHALPALTRIIAYGIFLGVVWAAVTAWTLASHGFVVPAVSRVLDRINQSIVFVFAATVPPVLLYELICRAINRSRLASLVATGVFCLPLFAYSGYLINRYYLPWFFDLKSIIWNVILSGLFLALWFSISPLLARWREFYQRLGARTGLLAGLVLVLVVLHGVTYVHSSGQTFDDPSVLFLVVDALRSDHLSCYGYNRNTTPHIDEFAKDSVLFTQAISQGTFTKTSIALLLTGRYAFQHGIYSGNRLEDRITADVLGDEEELLFEALLRDGFLTAAWVNNGHLRSIFGFAQGFLEYNFARKHIESFNAEFLDWVSEAGGHAKFAAYVHYLDLHGPYRPEPPYDRMYGVYSDVYKDVDFSEYGAYLAAVADGEWPLSENDVQQLIALYDGQLNYIDAQIGKLLEKLKEIGLYDDMMIVLTADHGDAFMEHGFIAHSRTPYDELIRVPLIIKFPRSRHSGERVDAQVQLVDVMPTVIEEVGQTPSGKLAGVSLSTYLKEPNNAREAEDGLQRLAISESFRDGGVTTALRSSEWKYLHLRGDKTGEELYHLGNDPDEQTNLIESAAAELERFRNEVAAIAANRRTNVERRALDEESIRRLKSLGYIE